MSLPPADDSSWTGPVRRFTMTVDRSLVRAFTQAISRDDPAVGDPGAGDPAGPDTDVVPPTFAVVADRFDPEFPRRPPPGQGWVNGPPETMLHVEQWFEFGPPLVVGTEVEVRRGPGRRWEKRGRSGHLSFVEERTELIDAAGVLRVATGWVDVRTEAAHRDLTSRPRAAEGKRELVGVRPHEVVAVREITPTHFVRYVGAAGDLHPLHHDRAMALALGYRDVFAPGMLTMALTVEVLRAAGSAPLVRLSSRFRSQVWPGDALIVAVVDHGDGTVGARTRNQFDEVVLETTATTV